MNRRGFLGGLIGVVAAPAIVRAESLMKIWVPPVPKILTGERIALLQRQILMSAIPKEVLLDTASYGTGIAQALTTENGLIRFRRVNPFDLFQPDPDKQLIVERFPT